MLRILSIFGTRPEAIKMAPVVRELARFPREIESVVCVTGQHRQMLDQVLALFQIKPDIDLDLMEENQAQAEFVARALVALDDVIQRVQPDWVLVQGDTTTAMIGAVAAFYRRVKVGHIEAGLRSWDKFQPFPEEINRRFADTVSDLHFAPTATARQNLLREGQVAATIHITGNTVIDALQWVAALPPAERSLDSAWRNDNRRLILVTAHRRENFGAPLENICLALRDLAEKYRDAVRIVYPAHLNPNVQEPAHRLLRDAPNITLLPPLGYLPLVQLMKRAYFVLTDSGGIQEEAPGLGKPVLVLREVTERPEAVDAGTVKLVGTARARIVAESARLMEDAHEYARMARAINPYGDGRAAERIVKILLGKTCEPFSPSR